MIVNNKEYCPHCNVDLIDSNNHTRKIGITSVEVDRILHWKCPNCDEEWSAKRKLKEITMWYKEVNKEYKFNHIEDGWIKGEKPLPKSDKFSNQNAWLKDKWISKFGTMDGNFIVRPISPLK